VRVLLVMEATIGGTRRHIGDLGRGLLAAGHEVHLVLSALRQPDFERDMAELEDAGCRVHNLPMVRAIRPATDWRHAAWIKRYLREVRPDIVHTHSSKAGVLGRHASLATGIGARVHTPHTFAFLFGAMFSPAKRRLFRAIEQYYGRRTDRLIAVSATEAETIRAAGVLDPARVRTVYNGIDTARWSAAEPADLAACGVPEGALVAVVVGLLNSAKGQDLAIEALAQAAASEVHLLFVGHGEDEAMLRALAERLGVTDRVHFLGWRTDVPSLVAASDWLLLPSRWEGMPYVVLEAMAAARPVLASRVDGARELVRDGENGLLVDSGSADALAQGLRRVSEIGRDGAREMGRAGERGLEARFTVEGMTRATVEVYEEAL